MHLRFWPFPKNSETCHVWVRIIHLTMAPTHGTFPSFLEMDKTAGAYSLQIYDYFT